MGKFISLGEYNKLYKYIWIYTVIKFISSFVFDYELIFVESNVISDRPYSPFFYLQFNYFFFIIISTILIFIKKYSKNKESIQNLVGLQLIFNEPDIKNEYGVEQKDYFLFVNLFLVVVTDLLDEIIYKFKCGILNYWMFEMLFFELLNSKILKTKIYKHHIVSFIFILSSCSIIKTIDIILSFANNIPKVDIFENREWLIPLGVIVYLLFQVLKAYIFCNEKYYLEKRVISISGYLLCYGLFGVISTFICLIISTYVPCGDNTIPQLSKIVCSFEDNEEIYYFDSYILYFKELISENFGYRLILIISESILYYASNYYIYVIYKKLSPIYHICMKRLGFLILDILVFINDIKNKDEYEHIDLILSILNIILLFFYLFGSSVYLEFIELNFCNLNFNTRRKIRERAYGDLGISLGDTSVNSESISESNG